MPDNYSVPLSVKTNSPKCRLLVRNRINQRVCITTVLAFYTSSREKKQNTSLTSSLPLTFVSGITVTRAQYFRDVSLLHTQDTSASSNITTTTIQEAITQYINRNSDELTRLKSERRPGRPPSTREDLLNNMLKQEEDEYKSGFEIPDLQDEKNVEALQEWTGEWNTMMSRIKFVRVARDGGVVSVPNKVT